jgi:hypothetical protein
MKDSITPGLAPGPAHSRRLLSCLTFLLATGFVAGCASPGPPRAPSLNLPETVKDLSTERVGDVVRFYWTTPAKTTDHLDVKGTMTAEVCRISDASAQPLPLCTAVARLPVLPGVSQASEALPKALSTGPAVLLGYRIQILNAHGRSAGASPIVFAAGGAAPPPVDQLRASPSRDGAVVEWRRKDESAVVELVRLPVGADGVVLEPAPRKPAAKTSSSPLKKPGETHPHQAPQASASQTAPKLLETSAPVATEVKLRTPAQLADAGGTVDHTALRGSTYQYTAQRVRVVSLGGHTLEVRSPASLPVTVVMRDIFAPSTPSGLEAAPGGTGAADRSIDLSWTPDTDANLAGYIVYRQEIDSNGAAAGTAARLNPTPVVGPAYRDQTARAGHRYAYRVAAVDATGNESAPSDAVQEILREQ